MAARLLLMAKLGLTEDEILQASLRSNIIKRELTEDNSGIADGIMFQHKDAPGIERTKPVRQ